MGFVPPGSSIPPTAIQVDGITHDTESRPSYDVGRPGGSGRVEEDHAPFSRVVTSKSFVLYPSATHNLIEAHEMAYRGSDRNPSIAGAATVDHLPLVSVAISLPDVLPVENVPTATQLFGATHESSTSLYCPLTREVYSGFVVQRPCENGKKPFPPRARHQVADGQVTCHGLPAPASVVGFHSRPDDVSASPKAPVSV